MGVWDVCVDSQKAKLKRARAQILKILDQVFGIWFVLQALGKFGRRDIIKFRFWNDNSGTR